MTDRREIKKFYLTTAIPYVNAPPHVGHALEFVEADAITRYHRLRGKEVLLLSGSDENALKNVQAAEAAGVDVQRFVDENASLFGKLAEKLGAHFDVFQKGSDTVHHYPSSQELWRRCAASEDVYKKSYEGLYCVGCEAFYTPDELTPGGECPEHPGRKLDRVSEENYFFRLSRYQDRLRELIASDTVRIIPASRKNEVLSFLDQPLQDISISRSNERAKNWGVPVPDDPTQRIYVWFDALNIYQSGIGFGWDEGTYTKWWPADLHVIGKGILRFHAVYWPAFLLSAKLLLPKAIFVHGYLTVEGQKMSKTVGNVVDPLALIERYGADPVRYYLLREIPSGEDGDFSIRKFEDRYNGDLANGLGNLVARVATLGEKISPIEWDAMRDLEPSVRTETERVTKLYEASISEIRLNEGLARVWELVSFSDRYINETKPWVITDETQLKRVVANAAYVVDVVANLLGPFLPETSEKIKDQIRFKDSVLAIRKGENLFPRILTSRATDRSK